MGVPLVLAGPVPCDDQDRELDQRCRKRCLEPQMLPDLLHHVCQVCMMDERNERSTHAASRSPRDLVGDFFLAWAHFLWGERRESWFTHTSISIIREFHCSWVAAYRLCCRPAVERASA